jgi:dihydroorotase
MKIFALLLLAATLSGQTYDLVLKGGHVIDPKNSVNAVMDVAIAGGKIAAVQKEIPTSSAKRTADVRGLYVTPGLIDIHVHVYPRTGEAGLTGDSSVAPDAFSFRSGVTTMVDAGTTGWRNFPDFRKRVIDRTRTRVLALINIAGGGMGPAGEDDPAEMDAAAAAKMAKAHPDVVVGFKTAHFKGKGWPSIEKAVEAGRLTKLPVMVDFGYIDQDRNINTLFLDKLRPGDIYTHCFSGHRDEVVNGKLNPAMVAGRKRGIIFDIGHGAGSFYWPVANVAMAAGFHPDSISTDLHTGSMNAGMKDMLNVMSKILNLGALIEDVIKMSTSNPASQIQRPELGHIGVGAEADVAVLKIERGDFGFIDSAGARSPGKQRLVAEITVRKGGVVWDLNGRAATAWEKFPYRPRPRP